MNFFRRQLKIRSIAADLRILLCALPWLAAAGCHEPKQPDEPEEPPVWAHRGEIDDIHAVVLPGAPNGFNGKVAYTKVAREPSPARPTFLSPGGSLFFVLRLPDDLGTDFRVSLVHSVVPTTRFALTPAMPLTLSDDNKQASMILNCPSNVIDGLYDIELQGKRASYLVPHCVSVDNRPRKKFRIVHLSDMNVDDPSAPTFDNRLIEEINLLAPAFIVATGDFTDWSQLLDDPTGWPRTMEFLTQFEAPVFVVCGDHDHNPSFGSDVVNGPIGTIDYGSFHGLLLWDNAQHQLDDDQLDWIINDLRSQQNARVKFIVTHADDLSVLDRIAEKTDLRNFVDQTKLKMIIAGGHTDWDYTEFSDRIAAVPDLNYIRTHQSSTCLRDRATGVSHYRVIEVDGDRIDYIYPNDMVPERLQHSVPSGMLRIFYDVANDGTEPRVTATVQNALNQPFADARLWIRVAKAPDNPSRTPDAAGGKILQTLDAGSHWACRVSLDVPDKGGARVRVTTVGRLSPEHNLDIDLIGKTDIAFRPQRTQTGLSYYAALEPLGLRLKNRGSQSVVCWPIVRLNGAQLAVDRSKLPQWPISLKPGESVTLDMLPTLGRVSEGKHLLQVFFLEDPLKRLTTFPVTLRKAN